MKVVIPGGSGQVGAILARSYFAAQEPEIVILSRRAAPPEGRARTVVWDGKTLGSWTSELDGADVVINLAGRSVNCRYTEQNMRQMMDSRVDSTRVVGEAIASAQSPPRLWLQMSTATIYAHRFDAPNDEQSGLIGGDEDGVPDYWGFSVEIAKAWEAQLEQAETPDTRKVALRSSMVMSPDPDGVFDVLCGLVKARLGGTIAGGQQFVSWIHDIDFVRALEFLSEHEELDGAINVCGPNPLPQRESMKLLREALGVGIGLPAMKWMVSIGAVFLRTDPELVLKSRRVVPGRLLDAGFEFEHPLFGPAAHELVGRM